jgi:lactoylglutathione lyase
MNTTSRVFAALAFAAATSLPPAALAEEPDVRVRAVRIAATDPEAAAGFYSAAFGMHEIRRINGQGFVEIVMNTGADVEAARQNPHAPIVLMTRPAGFDAGGMAYLLLNVRDMAAALDKVEAAGGTLSREPKTAASGVSYAFVKDPEGNQIELLTAPAAAAGR